MHSTFYCSLVGLLLCLLCSACSNSPDHKTLTTEQAIDMINEGNIREIAIVNGVVALIGNNRERYRVSEAPADQVAKWLVDQGVAEEQLANIPFAVTLPSESNSPWLTFISLTPIPLMILQILLIVIGLVSLGKRTLPTYARIIWALIILLIPILGPLAFLFAVPNTNS